MSAVRVCLIAWVLLATSGFALGRVSTTRPAWSHSTPLAVNAAGVWLSERITHFSTPYVSYAEVRGMAGGASTGPVEVLVVSGVPAHLSETDLRRRALVTMRGRLESGTGRFDVGRTVLLPPVRELQVAVVSAQGASAVVLDGGGEVQVVETGAPGAEGLDPTEGRYALLNAGDLSPEAPFVPPTMPPEQIVATWPHPRGFPQFQFGGDTAATREAIRAVSRWC